MQQSRPIFAAKTYLDGTRGKHVRPSSIWLRTIPGKSTENTTWLWAL